MYQLCRFLNYMVLVEISYKLKQSFFLRLSTWMHMKYTRICNLHNFAIDIIFSPFRIK